MFMGTLYLLMICGLSFNQILQKRTHSLSSPSFFLHEVQVLTEVGCIRGKSQHFPVKNLKKFLEVKLWKLL